MTAQRSRRRVLGVALALCAAGLVTSAAPVQAHAQNSLHDNWEGQPTWSWDTLNVPATDNVHAEASAVYFNNQWMMFHRYRGNFEGNSERYSIARSVSTDGTNFIFDREVVRPESFPEGCGSVHGPKVLVQPGLLTMVFEASPDAPGCPWTEHKWVVGITNSNDGLNWTTPRLLIKSTRNWEGQANGPDGRDSGNVGTPNINEYNGQIYVGYHANNGTKLRRAHVRGTDPTTMSIANVAKPSNPHTFYRQDGVTLENRTMFSSGFGAGDITTWHPQAGGTSEGGFYLVVEGFRGNVACGATDGWVTLAIARANTPAGPWSVQENVLYGEHQGTNDPGQCGRDMPSWQFHENRYKVIWTEEDREGLDRITLSNSYVPPLPPPPITHRWQLMTSHTSGGADFGFGYGANGDHPLVCDWDGNGTETPAVWRGNTFYIKNSWSGSGLADYQLSFGNGAGEIPICGDWNGDGYDTIGVMRDVNGDARWYLNNGVGTVWDVHEFWYGERRAPHYDLPVVGDWNGDGHTDVGLQRTTNTVAHFILATTVGNGDLGWVVHDYTFGNTGDQGIAGDWNGDGVDSIGLFRPSASAFYLANAPSTVSDYTVVFTGAGTQHHPVAGDYDGMGGSTVGLFRKQ